MAWRISPDAAGSTASKAWHTSQRVSGAVGGLGWNNKQGWEGGHITAAERGGWVDGGGIASRGGEVQMKGTRCFAVRHQKTASKLYRIPLITHVHVTHALLSMYGQCLWLSGNAAMHRSVDAALLCCPTLPSLIYRYPISAPHVRLQASRHRLPLPKFTEFDYHSSFQCPGAMSLYAVHSALFARPART